MQNELFVTEWMTEPEKIPAVGEIWSRFDLGEATKVITILAAFAYAMAAPLRMAQALS